MKNSNLETVASSLTCEKGSTRSLAVRTAAVIKKNGMFKEDPSREAWDFAKSVRVKYGENFTEEQARKLFISTFALDENGNKIEHKKSMKAKPSVNKNINNRGSASTLSRKGMGIAKDTNLSINERVRRLLNLDETVGAIYRGIGISQQRAINVVKKQIDKAVGEHVKDGRSKPYLIEKYGFGETMSEKFKIKCAEIKREKLSAR